VGATHTHIHYTLSHGLLISCCDERAGGSVKQSDRIWYRCAPRRPNQSWPIQSSAGLFVCSFVHCLPPSNDPPPLLPSLTAVQTWVCQWRAVTLWAE